MRWLDDVCLELIRAADREWNSPFSERGPATEARAFDDVFSRIDFDNRTVELSGDKRPLDSDPDCESKILELMGIVLRFGAYIAAHGIELNDDYFVDGRFSPQDSFIVSTKKH